MFGRATEEIDHLSAHGIDVEICPGVTAASAAAAGGRASLALRGLARRLTFVTAHTRAGEALDLDWSSLAAADSTLAVYMGRAAAAEVAREPILAGRHPETPVMIAVNISLPSERLIRGKLSALAFLVQAISDNDPTLLLIGEAVQVGAAASLRPARVAAESFVPPVFSLGSEARLASMPKRRKAPQSDPHARSR